MGDGPSPEAARERRLLTSLGAAAVGWWDWDIETDIVTANPDMAYMYGVSREMAEEGAPLEAFFANVHPADRAPLRDAVADAMATGEMFLEDYRIVKPDGGLTWVSARGRCLYDADGKPTTFPGVSIDITDRKLAEERGRDADMGRELALDAARLGWFDHKPNTGQRFYDARAIELMGIVPDDVKHLNAVLVRIHPDDQARVAEAVARAVDANRTGLYRQTFRVLLDSGDERWISVVGRTQFADGVCVRFMGVLEDVTEAKRAEAHRRLLANELNHRVKNTLAVMQGLVDSTLRSTESVPDARAKINARIQAYGRAHDLLTASHWSAAAVSDVVEGVIATLSLPRDRVELIGGPVRLGPQPALQLALALHELATNALKHGALANDTGRIAMVWGLELGEAPRFTFDWRERGGPPVTAPARKGFGSQLIERATAAAFGGEVLLEYEPAGVHWRVTAPYGGLAESGRAPMLGG